MANFAVFVSNVGTVYYGPSLQNAWLAFEQYREHSLHGYGRASGETVICIHGDEIIWEHIGALVAEECE